MLRCCWVVRWWVLAEATVLVQGVMGSRSHNRTQLLVEHIRWEPNHFQQAVQGLECPSPLDEA